MSEQDKYYNREFVVGYITMLVLSVIEGAVFIFAGLQLVRITSWMSVITGALILLYGAASLISAMQAFLHKEWAYAIADWQAENKPVTEMFESMDDTEEEN